MGSSFQAGKHIIGGENRCFIIAEAGINHNGSLEQAKALIDAAVEAGADAVKFQTFRAKNLVTPTAPMAEYQKANLGSGNTQFEMLEKLELQVADHKTLIAYCESRNITFLSTPFSIESAELLAELDLPAFKVPSGEITNTPFLRHVASKKIPMIISTGMSNLAEVERAVSVVREVGMEDFVLLHCVSNYPASVASTNLRAMETLATAFRCPVGYSDHTLGITVPIAAVAMGAKVIEKHFTLSRDLEGPDHKASLEPSELKAMVQAIRDVEAALGDGIKRPQAEELNTAAVARKSIVATRRIPESKLIEEGDLQLLRPGTGLNADQIPLVLGRTACRTIEAGEMIGLEMLR